MSCSPLGFGNKMSRSWSSARSLAFASTFSFSSDFTMSTARWVRSLIMDSTSRPTYPTSVNLLASILRKGDFANLARRLAISVLPTPVGPIIIIFLGAISSRSGSGTCCLLHRFRSAMATERLAWDWPMIYLSSSVSVSLGVKGLISAISTGFIIPPEIPDFQL